ncbi:TonB-dependent siderophore receptor [Vibrio japonicus]|uniref:TonB-dependent siderophore receptor n=1 Tax=Vibrio japonicus TaxID=1824638 RepID=A0ABY5LLU1_9VIBR|nr:TonB-dependent siderophore receptor [Vibrio japonicus]UUM32836.1 TonB-dependent siderophore receptor [Vibrio japonicus]
MGRVNRKPLNKTMICCAVGIAVSAPVMANEEESYFDEVLVWGTKVSSNTDSIGAQDMSLKQADHMSDLLRDIPGVDVGGTHSVNQRINIRGLGETDLDIRLDGASQHANMFHHVGNLTLNPDILKSADIQVGNNSVTQNGLGGSVSFETKDAKDLLRSGEDFGARIFGGYASNANRQGSLTVYGLLSDNVDAMLYGHFVHRDDFEDGNGEESFGTEGDTYNILGKLGFEPSENHRFELAYDIYRDSGDYRPRPDMSSNANQGLSQDILLPTDYDRDTVTLSYELDTDKHSGKVVAYSSKTTIDRDERNSGWERMGRASQNEATNHNLGVNVKFQSDYALAALDNQVTYGADYMDKNSSSKYGGVEYMDESAISTAMFAENKLYVLDNWNVTGGLRYDHYKRKAETSTDTFDDVTWSLGTEWDINSDWTLFASARSLFKGPELLESFVKFQQASVLADDIKPETGLNRQGGIRYSSQLGDHFVGANVTVFQTDIDDYITETGSGTGYTFENLGDVEIKGFEISTSYGYDSLNSKISYSRSDIKDKTNGTPVMGAGGSMDMGDSIALTLDYTVDSIDTLFGWSSIAVLEEDNVPAGSDPKEAYDVHNIYAQWVPSSYENLSLTVGVDNIFDEAYVSHASRIGTARGFVANDYEPGRNFKLSASYQF